MSADMDPLMNIQDIQDELRSRLTIALSEVTQAKDVLSAALREVGAGAPRAAKVAITTDVSEAFARLLRAHDELNHVRTLLTE